MPKLQMQQKSYHLSDGRCVFCLQTFEPKDLTHEHIIPEALHGRHVIKKGSCKECARRSNLYYENKALNGDFFKVVRTVLDLKGKRGPPVRSTRHLPPVYQGNVLTEPDAEAKRLTGFDLDRFPSVVFKLLHYEEAGFLSGIDRGGELSKMWFGLYFTGKKSKPVTPHFTEEFELDHTAIALMIAKIGYCYAVAELGIDGFDGDEIRSLLFGERDDVYNFVGSFHKPNVLTNRFLHKLYLREQSGFQTVLVHLFASFGGKPHVLPYQVVVGRKP